MRSVSYRLEDFDSKKKIIIPIGFVGENEFTQVNIDCHCVLKDHPNAVVTSVITPPKGDEYPGTLTRNGDIITWLVSASDVIYDGYGEIQLTFTDGVKIGKTWGVRTKIEPSAAGSGNVPTPIQTWIENANGKLADVEAATAEIDNMTVSASGSAYGSDPTATVTEVEEHKHIAFTIPAGQPGQNGQDGHTPVKGTDYWTEQDKSGIVSDVVETMIDDEAGEGDTDKVVSADKYARDQDSVLTAIHGLTPDAQQSDIGKALILKTIDQTGKPTAFEYGEAGGGLSNEAIQALLACFANVAWIDDAGPIYYDALQDALNTGTKTLVSISAVYTQSIVYPEDSLDTLKSSLVVIGTYDDTSTATITEYTLSGTLAIGTSTITVTVDNITTTFTVDVYGFKPMRCETMRGTVGSNAYTSQNTSRVLNLCDVGQHKLKDDYGTLMNFYPVPIRSGVSVLKVSIGSDLDTTIQIVKWDETLNDWKRIYGTDWGWKPSQYSLSSYNNGTYACAIIGAKDSGTPGLPDNTYNFTNHVFADYDIHFE